MTNIGNMLFYESFNKVDGTVGVTDDFSAPVYFFSDNDYASYFETASTQKGCGKGNACIYVPPIQENNNYFITDTPKSTPTGKALLRFRAAGSTSTTFKDSVIISGSSGVNFDTSTFYPTKGAWTQYEVVVTGYTKDSQITFKGSRVFLDDILITEIPTITLRETATDDNTITYNVSGLRTVQLKRTLGAGYWNTLCLPFNVTKTMLEQAFGSDANPVINTLASVDNGVFNFTTAESVPAGTPFLLKVSTPVTDPTFTEVTITQATPLTVYPNNDGYGFAGTYSEHSLEIDGTNLFLGTDGNLYKPAGGENVMNGLRAYFIVPSGNQVRVAADESGNELGIESVTANTQEHIIYNMMGQSRQSGNLTRGIYIINGKKTIVR